MENNGLAKDVLAGITHQADRMIAANQKYLTKAKVKRSIQTKSLKIDPFFWNNGLLTLAVRRYKSINRQASSINADRLLQRKLKIHRVDNALYGYANFDELNETEHHAIYDFIMHARRDEKGSVLYRPGRSSAYLDTLGMICPFLFRYASHYNVSEARTLALQQFQLFLTEGIDGDSGLMYHGYDVSESVKRGVIGWGRGMGWFVFGLAESLRWVRPTETEFRVVSKILDGLLKKIIHYQRSDGGFSWQLQAIDGALDTSATAMVGHSMVVLDSLTDGTYYKRNIKSVEKCLSENVNSQSQVLNSSAECRGFAMYPQKFEVNSWGQASTALFFLELYHGGKFNKKTLD